MIQIAVMQTNPKGGLLKGYDCTLQEIEENHCTGIYIPAQNVRKFLDCLDPRWRQYVGLLLILEYAAKNGLAYWEATDLPLEPTTRSVHSGQNVAYL